MTVGSLSHQSLLIANCVIEHSKPQDLTDLNLIAYDLDET